MFRSSSSNKTNQNNNLSRDRMQWEEHSRPSSVMLLERYLIESNQEKITDNHKLRDSQQNYLPVICKSIKAIRVKERQEWLQTRDQRNIPTMHSMCSNVDPLIIEDRASCSVMLTLCDPMDYSPPGSSVYEIFQAGILEWVALSFSRESSPPRDQTPVSHIAGRFFTVQATREV